MGILDGIVEWVATQIMNILDMINTSVLSALGCNMDTFIRYFPAAKTFYSIIVAMAVGMLLLNLIFQLFKNFGIISGNDAEDPIRLTIRTFLFLFLVIYADEIVDMVLKIGGTPYTWLMTEELPPISFADFNSVLLTILGVSLNGSVALIALILLVILAWNYIKLLFEAAERYVLLGALVFTAPMSFSMGGSQSTSNIFKSWCRSFGSQIFMIIMNVWCLRIFTNMFANFISNPLSLEDGNFLIWFLCAVAFLKISQKIDSFVQMLGINAGKTGGSMFAEAAIAMKAFSKARQPLSSGTRGNASGGGYAIGSGETFLQGGLAGAVGRQFNQGAINNITGKSDSIASNIARSVYHSSLNSGGGFANSVISSVAKGDIGRTGTITGNNAIQAFQSYMGLNPNNSTKAADIQSNNVKKEGAGFNSAGGSMNFETSQIGSPNSSEALMNNSHGDVLTSAQQVIDEYNQNIGAGNESIGSIITMGNEEVGNIISFGHESAESVPLDTLKGIDYMIFGYLRVSSQEQNLDRQIEAMKEYEMTSGTVIDRCFEDKVSGKTFERPQYKALKGTLRSGDILIIKELDRLGRNMEQIKKEWSELQEMDVDIIVIDTPILNTNNKSDLEKRLISNIVFELLAYMAEKERLKIKQRQREGINAAKGKGKHLGRPKIQLASDWQDTYKKWKEGMISGVESMKKLNYSASTFYRKVKEYENKNKEI